MYNTCMNYNSSPDIDPNKLTIIDGCVYSKDNIYQDFMQDGSCSDNRIKTVTTFSNFGFSEKPTKIWENECFCDSVGYLTPYLYSGCCKSCSSWYLCTCGYTSRMINTMNKPVYTEFSAEYNCDYFTTYCVNNSSFSLLNSRICGYRIFQIYMEKVSDSWANVFVKTGICLTSVCPFGYRCTYAICLYDRYTSVTNSNDFVMHHLVNSKWKDVSTDYTIFYVSARNFVPQQIWTSLYKACASFNGTYPYICFCNIISAYYGNNYN